MPDITGFFHYVTNRLFDFLTKVHNINSQILFGCPMTVSG